MVSSSGCPANERSTPRWVQTAWIEVLAVWGEEGAISMDLTTIKSYVMHFGKIVLIDYASSRPR